MIALPMTLKVFIGEVLEPALELLPPKMATIEARVMLCSIAMQESGLAHRWQVVDANRPWIKGPARGLMQFEKGGGVAGVLKHAASRAYTRAVCEARGVAAEPDAVYDALDQDDILAVALGRLLLWTDPRALPSISDQEGGWELYARVWRPGKPHPEQWPTHHRAACLALGVA